MWDLIVITAGDEAQARTFRKQLSSVNLRRYANNVQVVADPSDAGRLGSGGSMIYLADKLRREHARLDQMHVLLVHSGGYAQRMAYQSIYGKCFAYLPGGVTILEQKLKIYERLQFTLPYGLVVTASDVIEGLSSLEQHRWLGDSLDMILFGTECDLETANGHGVFVKNGSSLKCVLQKPTVQEMRDNSAVLPDGCALTDCFYWMAWTLVTQLAKLKGTRPVEQEICCYGDFMRPLGTQPKLDYLQEGSPNLQAWRRDLNSIFGGASTKVINLGKESFFHFGTHAELVSHLDRDSPFYRKFLSEVEDDSWAIRSRTTVSDPAEGRILAEFCTAPNVVMKQNVIASCLHTTTEAVLEDVMVFTVALKGKRYVTCAIPMGVDVKKTEETLVWMGRECGKNTSLWRAAVFPVRRSRNESFRATYDLMRGATTRQDGLISMDQIVFGEADLDSNLMFRKSQRL